MNSGARIADGLIFIKDGTDMSDTGKQVTKKAHKT